MARLVILGSYAESLVNFRGPLIQDLLARHHSVVAVAPDVSRRVRATLARWGADFRQVPLHRTRLNPFSDLLFCVRLILLLRAVRPDVVLSYTIKPVLYGSIAAGWCRVPTVASMITGLGYAMTPGGAPGWLLCLIKTLYRLALRFNTIVIFQNPDDQALFAELRLLGKRTSSLLVAGSGVDLEHFAAQPLPPKTSCLLAARLLRSKGVPAYAQAARLVKARRPEVTFKLAGWIDSNPHAIRQDELDEWIRSGTIDYLGKLDDIRPAMREASIYVLPSTIREGLPRSVAEAMAVGRAVVTMDAPGCRETVFHAIPSSIPGVLQGDNGFLLPSDDGHLLAAVLEYLMDRPELIAAMGAASRRLAETHFDVHRVNAAILDAMRL